MRCDGRGGAKAKPDAFSQPVDPSGGALDEPLDIFRVGGSMFLFKAFRSRVTFSLAPECVEVDCWNQAFQAPLCHQDRVVVVIVVVVPTLTKGYIGNAFLKSQNEIYDIGAKFLFCNKMLTARRPMDLFEI